MTLTPIAALLLTVASVMYFAPSVIAWTYNRRNAGAIFALNLLLAWTGLGWIVAFVWSLVIDIEEYEPPRYLMCADQAGVDDGFERVYDTETRCFVQIEPEARV